MFKRNPNCIIHLSTETGAPPIPVYDKKFIIGRKATHVVAIPDNSISRDHIEVQVTDSEVLIKDLGTSNGTKIDGQTIASQVPIPYTEGQMITLGHSTIGIVIELFSKNKKNPKPNQEPLVIQPLPQEDQQESQNISSPSYNESIPVIVAKNPEPFVVHQNPNPSISEVASAAPQLYPSIQISNETEFVMKPEQPLLYAVPPVTSENNVSEEVALISAKDEANRILARAKIEAEMQVRDLIKSKEADALAIISQAQKTAMEKIKEAEAQSKEMLKIADEQVQILLKKADEDSIRLKETIIGQAQKEKELLINEGEKIKHNILEETKKLKEESFKEKEKILQEAEIERQQITDRAITLRESALKEFEDLNLKIPTLKEQIQLLQSDIQKFLEDKNKSEVEYQKVEHKLQITDSQVKSQEELFQRLKDDFTNTQKLLNEAEEQKRQAMQSSHKMMMEAQEALNSAHKKEQETNYLLDTAKKQKEESDKYVLINRQETDAEVQRKLNHLKEELDRRTTTVNLDLETKIKKVNSEVESKTLKLNQEIESKTKQLNLEIESKTKQINQEIETRKKQLDQEIDNKSKQFQLDSERKLKLLDQESEKKINSLNLESQKILSERERTFNEMKRRQDMILAELKQSEDSKMKAIMELDGVMKNKREALEKEINDRIMGLNGEYERKRTSLHSEFTALRANYEKELNEHKDLKDKEFNEIKIKREQEFKEMKVQQDAYLTEMKRTEEEKVRLMLEESQKYLKSQREIRVKNVNEAIEKYFGDLLKNSTPEFATQAPFIRDNIKLIIQDNINNEFAGEENKLRQILDYNPDIANKHKKFWKKAAIWGGVFVVVISYLLYKPSTIQEIPKQMEQSVHEIDQENKKVIHEQQEAIRLAQIYRPEQSEQFQESYTDNVLYTKRYLEFEYNDKSYKDWVVIINKFLQDEVGMKDDESMQFISNESSLVHNLETKKALIDGTKPENGIKAMRQIEDEYQALMESALKGKRNEYWKLKKSHFEKFITETPHD